eukprot:11404879-Alexandrium_andersonii.AAC.1
MLVSTLGHRTSADFGVERLVVWPRCLPSPTPKVPGPCHLRTVRHSFLAKRDMLLSTSSPS